MSSRERFTVPLQCPKCGTKGAATWEENESGFLGDPQSTLEDVSTGFYRRLEKSAQGKYEIICDKCGTLQPG